MFSRRNAERLNSHEWVIKFDSSLPSNLRVHLWAMSCIKMNEYTHPMESACVRRFLFVRAFRVVRTSSIIKFWGWRCHFRSKVWIEVRLRLGCAKEWQMNGSWHKVFTKRAIPTCVCVCVEGAFSMGSQLHPNPPLLYRVFPAQRQLTGPWLIAFHACLIRTYAATNLSH